MDCKKDILTLPFEYNMSWFVCILVVTMYSQRIREITLEASKRWNNTFPLFKLFSFILHMKYVSKSAVDYEYFESMTLENLCKELQNYDENKFWFSTDVINPMHAKYYIKNLYDFFDISSIMISVYADEIVTLDPYNNVTKIDKGAHSMRGINVKTDVLFADEIQSELDKTPNILIIRLSPSNIDESTEFRGHQHKFNYYLTKTKNITEILLHDDMIVYNDQLYRLDAALVDNVQHQNHTIAGISCSNKRYIYNGWKFRQEGDNMIPCELMDFNWDTNSPHEFCLHNKKCSIVTDSKPRISNCFSLTQGERILIYVKSKPYRPQFNSSSLPSDSEYSLSKRFAPTGLLRLQNTWATKTRSTRSHKKVKSKSKPMQPLAPVPE